MTRMALLLVASAVATAPSIVDLQPFRRVNTAHGATLTNLNPAVNAWFLLTAGNMTWHLENPKPRWQQVSLDEMDTSQDEPVKRDYGSDDLRLIGSVDRIGLQKAIADLPPGYRTVFVLHDIEGYEHNEIAEIMSCSVGNSKSQLHKARMKLRERLLLDRGIKPASAALPAGEPVEEV